MKQIAAFFFLLVLFTSACAQPFASWTTNRLLLDNGLVQREIIIEGGRITTAGLRLKDNKLDFGKRGSPEFSFLLNGAGYDGSSGWELQSFMVAKDDHQGDGATVRLQGTGKLAGIELAVTYWLYPGLPVIRKQIAIVNRSGREIMLESLDIEKLELGFSFVESVVYSNYGRQKRLGTYVGNWDDPVMAIHSYAANAGVLLGNEAPGVLKRTAYNTTGDNVDIGLTHSGDEYPFRKYIQPGAAWTSPRTFIIPYADAFDPWRTMNNELAAFERRYMGLRLFENQRRPVFMYNNYRPFGSSFNDTLLISLAKAAAGCGIRQFEVDCGWHSNAGTRGKKVEWIANTGDWLVDSTKFPRGLQPVFDTVRRLGMEPGLWISVGSAAATSRVFNEHPQWAAIGPDGKPGNLHDRSDFDLNTMCFATGWKTYIKNKILGLVTNFGLRFVKLDLTVLTSAYVIDPKRSGCYAPNHPGHKDRAESFIAIYEQLFDLFDELHKAAPDLYIDCTFETEGKLQLIDYAFLEHAEADWLTNIGEPYPVGAYRVRDLAWWKSPAVPASSLIIGNLTMDSPDFINELKTLIGSFPIVLGDPRKLPAAKRQAIKEWGDWIMTMQQTYHYDLYRQDLPGFGAPVEGGWDAWARINTDTRSGGIIGVFRQGSLDNTRVVAVPGLDKNRPYVVKLAPGNTIIAGMSGKDLELKGFTVKMDSLYESRLYEIAPDTAHTQESKTIAGLLSPDGSIQIDFGMGTEGISYSVTMDGHRIINPSKLGLAIKNDPGPQHLILRDIKRSSHHSTWANPLGKDKVVEDHNNELVLSMQQMPAQRPLEIICRAFNDGIAFRYRFPGKSTDTLVLETEQTGFSFADNYECYRGHHPGHRFSGSQEWAFQPGTLSDIAADSITGLPLLVKTPVAWVAITESDLLDWSGMWLCGDKEKNGALVTRLAPRQDGNGLVKFTTPHASPWRVLMIGRKPGTLIESNMVLNLATPSRIGAASWVKPGMMAWDHWWSGDVQMNTATIKQYIQLAADMGWPYQLIDWQWYGPFDKPGADITRVNPAVDMEEIRRFAREKKVKLWLWLYWTDVARNDAYKKAFALYEQWGIAGIKIDFMDRDDQDMVNWYEKIAAASAAHHLMLDFHGAYKPTGLERTYPNQVTREGILGNEYNRWSREVTSTHKITLLFTRFLAGPADFTPGGFLNRQPDLFKPDAKAAQVQGTRASELALFVMYNSPVTVACDHPDNYRDQPGVAFLQHVPTVWQETRVLDARVADYAVIARRSGNDWYIGALTDSIARELTLPLDFLGKGKYTLQGWKDTKQSDMDGTSIEMEGRTVTPSDKLVITMQRNGGYAARLHKEKQ